MINNVSNSPSFGKIKYTEFGREFFKKQPNYIKKTLDCAETKMKNYRKAHLIINKNGYNIQAMFEDGIHCFKLNNVSFSCENDVIYDVLNSKGEHKQLVIQLSKKNLLEYQRKAAQDASEKNSWLHSTIGLINILEKSKAKPIRPSLLDKIKEHFLVLGNRK